MQTKLTLRLDKRLIRRAKAYARRSRKSVSKIVADYFDTLDAGGEVPLNELPPRVRSLLGALGRVRLEEKDYRRHLVAKHK